MTDRELPPAGFYEDSAGRTRWWDGTGWTEHVEAGPPPRMLSAARRTEILDEAVATYAKHGYTVESNAGRQAVLTKRQRLNVLLNLLLTVLTAGFWLVILAIRLLNWPVDRVVLTVDERGEIQGAFSS